jgi:hypothetical protein
VLSIEKALTAALNRPNFYVIAKFMAVDRRAINVM